MDGGLLIPPWHAGKRTDLDVAEGDCVSRRRLEKSLALRFSVSPQEDNVCTFSEWEAHTPIPASYTILQATGYLYDGVVVVCFLAQYEGISSFQENYTMTVKIPGCTTTRRVSCSRMEESGVSLFRQLFQGSF